MVEKSQKSYDKNGATAVGFAVQIPARPEAVGREISWPASSGGDAPHGPARVQ